MVRRLPLIIRSAQRSIISMRIFLMHCQLYLQVTGDVDYLKRKRCGSILIETARVWADVGCFRGVQRWTNTVSVHVTGPDEYNVLVDNNFYTNLMARENLAWMRCGAVDILKRVMHGGCIQRDWKRKLDFSVEELGLWREIIEQDVFPIRREAAGVSDG